MKRSYGYDRTGNLTHSSDQRSGTTHFDYDKLGRITQAGDERFAFDPAHNILSDRHLTGEGKTPNSNIIPDNRLKAYNGISYYHDELGNLIHRELSNGEVQNYFYDLHDQLIKAEIFKKDGTKETWVYCYDALGRRSSKGRLKTENSKEILDSEIAFLWDGSHLLQEHGSDGLYTYIYTDLDSYEPLAQIHNHTNEEGESQQQINYFHCDQIGIPREMTDSDGKLLWFGDYAGWGKLKTETNITNAHQPFRLQNQYCDAETGLHYNFFRYYEPDAGRFVNQDPIKLAGGSNLYWSAQNSQVWTDPLGLSASKSPGGCNDPCAGQDPAGEAAGWQGKDPYPGVDTFENVVLKKGAVIYSLFPGSPPGFAVPIGTLNQHRGNPTSYHEALQVQSKNLPPGRSMRTEVRAYRVTEDICVGRGRAKANDQFGAGGGMQYYIPSKAQGTLTPGKVISI